MSSSAARAMARTVAVLALVYAALSAAGEAFAAPSLDRLYTTIRVDRSFKVRMQALRLLTQRLEVMRGETPEVALTVLAEAARSDENHLVRGLACFALGRVGDDRARQVLRDAERDQHPFVQAQAAEAQRALDRRLSPGSSPSTTGRPLLVLAVELADPAVPPAVAQQFERWFVDGMRRAAEGRFEVTTAEVAEADEHEAREPRARRPVGEDSATQGYRLSGALTSLALEDEGGGVVRTTMVVRVTITTWPGNSLRQVVTARASARGSSKAARSGGLFDKLLKAAVDRAVSDSLAQLGGG